MEIQALHRQGWNISDLAREFGLDRRTIASYLEAPVAPRYPKRICPAEFTAEVLGHVLRRLEGCKTIRATTLYREVVEIGYAGSYVSFARRIRLLRPVTEREAEVRFETDPGVQTQIDWANLGLWPLGTEMVELKALVGILGFSRMPAIRFGVDKTRETAMAQIPALLHDLGGVTKEVLSDRDPVLVIGSTSDGKAIFAPEWIDLAASLGVTPKACKPYRAKTKGKVERMIREVKEDFLCWITGQGMPPQPSLYDYQELAARWATDIVGNHVHRTTGRVVREAWTEEVDHLRAIPERLLRQAFGNTVAAANVIDLTRFRESGAIVEHRDLADYEGGL
ncbi:MAG TPA: IS21 family transposase [Actinomycetota bacterium]|nr:IS21 family transposase [Actinomycetota bacterium]